MLEACRESCGVCPPAPQPTPDPRPSPGPCSDDNQFCRDWAASGQCETNPGYMLEACRESCGVCPPAPQPTPDPRPSPGPCSDDNQFCRDWAASGQCETNPGYMLEACRESCGVCPPAPLPTPGPPQPSPGPCSDDSEFCGDWAASGQCETNPGYMLEACPASCRVCTGPSPVPSPGGNGCCRFGADCGDCGEDDTGWCHQSASNCAQCTGTFDPSG